jgi:hypothetical protein
MMDLQEAIRRLHHPPVQIYSILSQAWGDLSEAEYTENLLALHRRVRHETLKLAAALRELEASSGDGPRDSFRPQADPMRYPPLDSRQYRFLFPDLGGASLLRHLPEGKKYLEGLGFSPGQPGTLQETEFYLSGSPALDFIEIAVRDIIGIDRGVHGKQIRAVSGAGFILRNRLMELGARQEAGQWAVLYFEKPGAPGTISYDIFRAALRTLLEDHLERATCPYACLHQRKLGLGRGAEFSLRIQLPHGPDPLLDAFLHDLFHEEGALEALRFGLTVQEEIAIP